ncbi:Nuclear pore complex protein Nup153 [Frankliniella fusca]|uniref:Nuclear pore complex protein Nup153 n=1 Tax=Frankliniella fusca TaxID=407009 RepID=A0AAE1GTZ5_9NEOP|nr:Nuclear pore complex protein Nup153 [Frankliniella fusca]
MSNNKSRSSRPYDPNNSFVKKVTSRVSSLIPRSTSWLSGWFSPTTDTDQGSSSRAEPVNSEEDHFEDALEKPPPTKRFKLLSNGYVDSYPRCQIVEPEENDNRLVSNNFDTSSIPGPSGLGNRPAGFVASTPAVTSMEHLEPKANGDDCSESGESTSGCSSLEPQINRGLPSVQAQSRQNDTLSPRKRLLDDKLNFSNLQNSRCLYLDRSNSRNNQTVGRRNNPSFCVSTFGTPLFGERGSVNDLILNSPFYTGRTTYGGASSASYRRSLGSASLSSSPANSEKRHAIKVKPGNMSATEDSGMSQTAKRILATLEQFSTPILDAKRIPVAQEPVLASLGSRKRTRAEDSGNSLLVLEQAKVPKRVSNKPMHWAKGAPITSQLTIPVAPDTLKLRRRDIVPETTPPTSTSGSLNAEPYKLRTESDNANSLSRNTLKMKPRLNDTKEPKEPEMVPEVNLPEVPLPISSLPTFDITVPAPKSDSIKPSAFQSSTAQPSKLSKNPPSTSTPSSQAVPSFKINSEGVTSDASFSFSSPIRVSSASKDQPLAPVNNFTFSKPLPASHTFSTPSPNCVKARPKATTDSPKSNDTVVMGLKPASELKTGSVMDILGKSISTTKNESSANGEVSLMDKFKPAAGTWECDQCFIRNKSDLTKCAACTNPREAKTPAAASNPSDKKITPSVIDSVKADSGFGAQFKLAQGMWECSECMVRNKDSEIKCVSCTSPKPGAAPAKSTATSFSGWDSKFKPASNTWECGVCMVRNGPELSACLSCTTKKPGSSATSDPPIKSSWGDQFKKPEGSWTCSECMITNKSADVSCVACSAKKPGSETSTSAPKDAPKFSFGIPASTASSFSFGIPKDKQEAEKEKSNVTSSTGFKFGESKSSASAATFTFGIPPASSPSLPATSSTEKQSFSATTSISSPSPAPSVKTTFEMKSPLSSGVQSTVAPNSKPAFSFGAPAAPAADGKPNPSPMFSFSKPSGSPIPTQSASSTASTPLEGKRKLGEDAPSSSAPPLKFGVISNQTDSQVNPLLSSASSVSSTSGPVFSFSSAASTAATSATSLLSATVTSSANGQNTTEAAKTTSANSIFSSLVSSPTSSTKPAPNLGLGLGTTKDESVSSTWKQPVSSNLTVTDSAKPSSDSNGAAAAPKPVFSFVSSSGMAFGSNTTSSTANFTFGAAADKTVAANKPAASFGSANPPTLFGSSIPASATPSFGSSSASGFGSLSNAANSVPSFSVTNSSTPSFNSQPAPAFTPQFGAASEEKKAAPFTFGANTEPKKSGFAFGSSSEETKKGFSFTGSTPAPTQNSFQPQTPGVFTFGAPAVSAPAPAPAATNASKPNFSFGSSTSFPSFNAQASQPPSAPPAFGFGTSPAPPTFGSSGNSATPFEATGPQMFNAPSTFNANAPFGTTIQPQSQSSGGFNFGSPAQPGFGTPGSNATPFAFKADQKPTFNFTTGNAAPVSFAATPDPSSAQAPARRFKKATRRTQR